MSRHSLLLAAGICALLALGAVGVALTIHPLPSPPVSAVSAGQWAQVADDRGAVVRRSSSDDDQTIASASAGERVFVLEGTLSGDGVWIPVQVGDPDMPAFGWIRQRGPLGTLTPAVLPGCPFAPNVLSVVFLAPAERLTCFGSRPVTFESVQFDRRGSPMRFAGTPEWLVGPLSVGMWGELGIGSPGGSLAVAITPGLSIPSDTRWYQATGHFGDDSASQCSVEVEGLSLPDAWAVLWCREQFVITAITPGEPPQPSRDSVPPGQAR